MSVLIEEIEAIARRVYRQEKEHELGSRPPEAESTLLDSETQDKINQYLLISHKPYLTRKEAAVYLNVSERSIAEWAARPSDQNPFPESRAGGEPRVRRESIDEWAAREGARRRLRAVG
jgi:excisionase family DNA binding protein